MKDLQVTLDSHTVKVSTGLMAGFLVRCTSSRREIGFVWTAGGVWCWRSMTGNHFGERVTKRVAVETLRDAYRVANGIALSERPTDCGILAAWRASRAGSTQPTARKLPLDGQRAARETPPVVAPAPPARRIVWADDAPDLTKSVASAFGQRKETK